MFRVETEFPIAYDSPDHIMPWGTMNDNSTNLDFIKEISDLYNGNYKFMDLGCSGGQLVVDIHNSNNIAIGLEGSDYSIKHNRANWPEFNNKILFTCDIVKPYTIYYNNASILFNVITAWEVVEHIKPSDLEQFFININNHLEYDGLFLASISTHMDIINGVHLHQSVFSEVDWYNHIFPKSLEKTKLKIYQYPFNNKVRSDGGSFHICLRKEK